MAPNSNKNSLPEADVRKLMKLDGLLSVFRTVSPTMPLQIAHTFVIVAMHEGGSLVDLAKLTGFATSTMSRHLLDLGDRNRKMEPGYGLIERRQSPQELRRNEYTLTPKGRALLRQLLDRLEA